ncbi:MAG: MCE family protein [Myxococcales bacterium]|nr:MCE family protein [Myxococcales bacterium]
MTSKTTKLRVGLFVAITAGLLAVVIIVFGGMRFWEDKAHFKILFDDSVMGLEKGAQVYLNGIKVGRVDRVEVSREDLTKVLVSITVADDALVHTDTVAMLQYAGITGLKVIDLRQGTLGAPLLPEGSTIAQGKTVLDKMEKQAIQIADQSEQLMKRAGTIVDNLVALTDPKRFEGVEGIMAGAKATAANLAEASGALHAMVAENRVALKDTLGAMRGTVTSVQTMIDGHMNGLVSSAGELLADLKSIVHGSEGPIRSAVFDLRQASRNFKELTRDVRARPSRLLFSNAPSERKLP